MIGETEQAFKSRGGDYAVGFAPYSVNARGRIAGDMDGFLKLLVARADMKILGAHAIGE